MKLERSFSVIGDEQTVRGRIIEGMLRNGYNRVDPHELIFRHGSLIGTFFSVSWRHWLAYVTIKVVSMTGDSADVKVIFMIPGRWALARVRNFWIMELDLVEAIARGKNATPYSSERLVRKAEKQNLIIIGLFLILALLVELSMVGSTFTAWILRTIIAAVIVAFVIMLIYNIRLKDVSLQRKAS